MSLPVLGSRTLVRRQQSCSPGPSFAAATTAIIVVEIILQTNAYQVLGRFFAPMCLFSRAHLPHYSIVSEMQGKEEKREKGGKESP